VRILETDTIYKTALEIAMMRIVQGTKFENFYTSIFGDIYYVTKQCPFGVTERRCWNKMYSDCVNCLVNKYVDEAKEQILSINEFETNS
jgi:hypothetical protein